MGFLLALIPSRAKLWAFAAAAGAVFLTWFRWNAKRQGRKEAMQDAREADHNRATEIRDAADEVRRRHDGMPDDAVDEWLRGSPARRD